MQIITQHSREQSQKSRGSSQTGASKITILFFGVLTAAVVYTTYHVLPFYYYYFELRNQMISLTRVASVSTDQEIRRKLSYHIKKMGVPLDVNDVRIARDGHRIKMEAAYQEVFYIPWGDEDKEIHTFDFHILVDETYD